MQGWLITFGIIALISALFWLNWYIGASFLVVSILGIWAWGKFHPDYDDYHDLGRPE